MSPDPAVKTIGRFEVLSLLALGGSGARYLARDPVLDRLAVVQLLPVDDAESQERFLREARSVGRLSHPNIALMLDCGLHEGRPFVAMEHLAGESLAELIANRPPLPIPTKLAMLRNVCRGLGYAQARGVATLDITPECLMVDRESGMARIAGMRTRQPYRVSDPAGGWVAGAIGYMAPELIAGGPVDSRADVFTLGVVAYELLAYRKPFAAESPVDLIREILEARPAPLPPQGTDVDGDLAATVERALAKAAEDRYPDAAAFESALGRVEERLSFAAGVACEKRMPASSPPGVRPASAEKGADAPLSSTGAFPAASTADRKTSLIFEENVQFTVFRPKVVEPLKWHDMLVFAHLSERRPDADPDEPDPIEEVARQASTVLGDTSGYRRQTEDSSEAVPREGELTVVPSAEGFEFNPPSLSFLWKESVHREEFRMRAGASLAGRTVHGRVTVYLGVIILAEIGTAFKVEAHVDEVGGEVSDRARAYRKIFASYSHRDRAIVDEVSAYASAVGGRYLRDIVDLRSGEEWSPALENLIRQADLFQLFWSWNALDSPYVRQEWEYALSLRKPNFVRPVYWDEPLPARGELPPADLRRLHFARIPLRRGANLGLPAAPAAAPEPPGATLESDTATSLEPLQHAASVKASTAATTRPTPPARQARRRGGASWRVIASTVAAVALVAVALPTMYLLRQGGPVAMPPPPPSSTATSPVDAASPAPPVGTPAGAATARLIISVRDEQGPVPRAFVQLVNLKTQAVVWATADVKGQARFEVPPGEYRVEARRTDAARAEQRGQFLEIPRTRTVTLGEGSNLQVGLELPRGGPRGR